METIHINELPAIGGELAGGIFAGLTTTKENTHCAVVLLSDQGEELTWEKAKEWADALNAALPTRPVAALIFANVRDKLRKRWHWTSEEDEDDASCAWGCDFYHGGQDLSLKSFEGSAVAVRLIQLSA